MSMNIEEVLELPVPWQWTGEATFAYTAVVEGSTFMIRVNDFPEEDLYTLLVDGDEIVDFTTWPKIWVHPYRPDVEAEVARMEREAAEKEGMKGGT